MKTSKIFGQSLYKWFFQDLRFKGFSQLFFQQLFFQGGVGADQIFFFGKIIFLLLQNPSFCRERMGLTEAEAVGKMWSGVKAMIQVADDTDDTNDTGSEHRYSKKQKQ